MRLRCICTLRLLRLLRQLRRMRILGVLWLLVRTSLLRVLASEGLTPDPSTAQVATARARELWVRNAPPGSHWLRPGGCGATIEYAKDEKPDPGRLGLLCGMGHVQPHEQRFLAFYDVLS